MQTHDMRVVGAKNPDFNHFGEQRPYRTHRASPQYLVRKSRASRPYVVVDIWPQGFAHLCAGVSFFSFALGIDVERLGAAFDHIAGNHHFFHTIKTRQLKHGFQQD